MKNFEGKKLSSSWTNFFAIASFIFGLLVPFLIINEYQNQTKEFNLIILLIMIPFIAFLSYGFYLSINLSKAKADDNLILKKMFRKPQHYSFDKIGLISSFNYKKLKFTKVKMKKEKGKVETFFILNNNALLSGERTDAEIILRTLKRAEKNKKAV